MKKIQRVKAMSEQNKKMFEIQQHIKHLQGIVKTGKATKDMYDKMCDVESIIKERMQDFIKSAHKYNGDPEIVREWCENFLTVNGKQFQKRAFSKLQTCQKYHDNIIAVFATSLA